MHVLEGRRLTRTAEFGLAENRLAGLGATLSALRQRSAGNAGGQCPLALGCDVRDVIAAGRARAS